MKQKVFYILVPAAVLLGAFVYLWIAGAQDAAQCPLLPAPRVTASCCR